MENQLNKEQILLINNLMYIDNEYPFESITNSKEETVGDYINKIASEKIDSDKEYGSFMTGDDWKNTINAIKQDEQLMDMKIADTHVDNSQTGGGGESALFVDPKTGEAVVTFRGTANHEWQDNFVGGGMTDAADGVSTPQQENALKWYQSLDLDEYSTVTVTGHSKGGNKAKYITVLDDSVDRCVSFDGQGFSDEFVKEYNDQIAANQNKISNHNVDKDYVNLLLNDIGNTTFYHGYDYGEGGFLENHCPNTFFQFQPDGTVKMNESVRDEGMASIDEFLNSYLRTLSPEDKKDALAMIGKMVEMGFNGEDVDDILGVLLDDNNVDLAANLAAYLLVYKKEHPELVDNITTILDGMGLENISGIVNTITDITDWKYFDKILGAAGWLGGHLPDKLYEWLLKELEKNGITLSKEELKKLLSMLETTAEDMKHVDVTGDGSDLVIKEIYGAAGIAGGKGEFSINVKEVLCAAEELESKCRKLRVYAKQIRYVASDLVSGCHSLREPLFRLEGEVLEDAESCEKMGEVLKEICYCYCACEKKIAGSI